MQSNCEKLTLELTKMGNHIDDFLLDCDGHKINRAIDLKNKLEAACNHIRLELFEGLIKDTESDELVGLKNEEFLIEQGDPLLNFYNGANQACYRLVGETRHYSLALKWQFISYGYGEVPFQGYCFLVISKKTGKRIVISTDGKYGKINSIVETQNGLRMEYEYPNVRNTFKPRDVYIDGSRFK